MKKITTEKTDGQTTINFVTSGVDLKINRNVKWPVNKGSSLTFEGETVVEANIIVPMTCGDDNACPPPADEGAGYIINGKNYLVAPGSTIDYKKGENGEPDQVTITAPAGGEIYGPETLDEEADSPIVKYKPFPGETSLKVNDDGTQYNIGVGEDGELKYSSESNSFFTDKQITVDGYNVNGLGKNTNLLFGDQERTDTSKSAVRFNKNDKKIDLFSADEDGSRLLVNLNNGEDASDYGISLQETDRLIARARDGGQISISGSDENTVPEITVKGPGDVISGNTMVYAEKNSNVYSEPTTSARITDELKTQLGISDSDKVTNPNPYMMFRDENGEDIKFESSNGETTTIDYDYGFDAKGNLRGVNREEKSFYANAEFNKLLSQDDLTPEQIVLQEKGKLSTKEQIEGLYKTEEGKEEALKFLSANQNEREEIAQLIKANKEVQRSLLANTYKSEGFSTYSITDKNNNEIDIGYKYNEGNNAADFDKAMASLNKASPKNRIVVFTADNCPPCQTLKKGALNQLSAEGNEIVYLNSKKYSANEYSNIANNMGGVSGMPTSFVSKPDGSYGKIGVGNMQASKFKTYLTQ